MNTTLSTLYLLIKKDFILFFMRGGGLWQSLLLGLLLIFVFSLSQEIGSVIPAKTLATLFWLASIFCMVLIFNNLHSIEEQNAAKSALHLMPLSIHFVWLSKALCGTLFMLFAQILFFFALVIFCNASVIGSYKELLFILFLINIGMASSGSLLGALAVGQTGKESLLSIILFPLLTPLLLGGIELFSSFFSSTASIFIGEHQTWFFLILAFNGLFLTMALLLFPFIYTPDN